MTQFFFFDKEVDGQRLHIDIINSGLEPVLEYVHTSGTTVTIATTDSITPPEEATLSGTVAAHVNISLPKDPATSGAFVHTLSGLSGLVVLESTDGTVTFDGQQVDDATACINFQSSLPASSGALLAQVAELVGSGVVNRLNGLSGVMDIVSGNDGLDITVNGQTIQLDSLFTSVSGALIDQRFEDINTISGTLATRNTKGVSLNFTPASGSEFVMEHGMCTEKFTWNMWTTETVPDCIVYPQNVVASGKNHVIVDLDTPMSGFLNLIGIEV